MVMQVTSHPLRRIATLERLGRLVFGTYLAAQLSEQICAAVNTSETAAHDGDGALGRSLDTALKKRQREVGE